MKNKILIFLLIILSIASLFIGVNEISIKEVLTDSGSESFTLITQVRLPRLISIITAGMSMSIAGLIMQKLSRNKFVSPSTAATVDSAKLGILISIIVFKSNNILSRMLISFSFALLGTFFFMKLIGKIKIKNQVMIPLIGIMLGGIIDSLSSFLAYRFDIVQNISSWLEGDFSMIIKGRYELLFISIPLLVLSIIYANKFTVVGMGEDFAINLGLNHKQITKIGLFIVALSSAIVIITVGRIPFLGLIIPNIVTMVNGDNLENVVSTTALFGAVFLLASDIFSRLILFPYEVSISLTVGIVGSVIFLYLLFKEVK